MEVMKKTAPLDHVEILSSSAAMESAFPTDGFAMAITIVLMRMNMVWLLMKMIKLVHQRHALQTSFPVGLATSAYPWSGSVMNSKIVQMA
jgi:hypothetical protein